MQNQTSNGTTSPLKGVGSDWTCKVHNGLCKTKIFSEGVLGHSRGSAVGEGEM